MKIRDKIIKAVDVREILEHYGAQRIRGQRHIRSTCPLHGGDNPSALVFDEVDKVWYCHTGCAEGGSIFDFVAKMEGIDFKEAAEFLGKMFNVDIDWTLDEVEADEFGDLAKDFIEQARKAEREKEALPLYDPVFTIKKIRKYRNYSQEALEHFRLGVAIDGELADRIVVPLIDPDNRQIGYSGRRIKANTPAKWMHKPNGLQLGRTVPGIGQNKQWIEEQMEMLLVEGLFDVIRVWDYGYKNVATTMAANITDEQVRIIQTYVFTLTIGFDNDLAGRNATRKVIEKFSSTMDLWILDIPEGMDPCDMSKEEFDLAYENKMKPYEFYDRYGLKKEKGNA